VQHVAKALAVPNAALRYSPPARKSEQETSLLRRLGLLRGRPRSRPASQPDEGGPQRKVWVLSNGAPSAVSVVVGASDGQRTEIVKGDLKEGQEVIVDSTTGKR
jgi:HlyD family secretion protein